nr:MAG TPA: hypothetical protein [Caudoviricetes sp.]
MIFINWQHFQNARISTGVTLIDESAARFQRARVKLECLALVQTNRCYHPLQCAARITANRTTSAATTVSAKCERTASGCGNHTGSLDDAMAHQQHDIRCHLHAPVRFIVRDQVHILTDDGFRVFDNANNSTVNISRNNTLARAAFLTNDAGNVGRRRDDRNRRCSDRADVDVTVTTTTVADVNRLLRLIRRGVADAGLRGNVVTAAAGRRVLVLLLPLVTAVGRRGVVRRPVVAVRFASVDADAIRTGGVGCMRSTSGSNQGSGDDDLFHGDLLRKFDC